MPEEVSPPVKVVSPPPQCTEQARAEGRRGEVIVQAIITKEGTVREVQVVEDELGVGMAQRVAQSVRRWKFEPATLEGKPVDVYYNAKVYVDCGSH